VQSTKKATVAAGLIPPVSESKKVNEAPKEDVVEAPKEDTKNVISMTQWLSIISISISVIGLYDK